MADLSDVLGSVLQNPELIATLASLLSQKKTDVSLPSFSPPDASELKRDNALGLPAHGNERALPVPQALDRRGVLLNGLRPYLCEKRCRCLDAALPLIGALESFGVGEKREGGEDVSTTV